MGIIHPLLDNDLCKLTLNMELSISSIYHNLHGRVKKVNGKYTFKFKEV